MNKNPRGLIAARVFDQTGGAPFTMRTPKQRAQKATDGFFAEFAVPATYTPPGGSSAGCAVIKSSQDRMIGGGFSGQPMLQGTVIEVRVAEVATVAADGVFALLDSDGIATGESYTVTGDPKIEDVERLVWTCTVR